MKTTNTVKQLRIALEGLIELAHRQQCGSDLPPEIEVAEQAIQRAKAFEDSNEDCPDSDALMGILNNYGSVDVVQSDSDKTYKVTANVFLDGIRTVVSTYGHPTLLEALTELNKRVMFVLRSRGDTPCA